MYVPTKTRSSCVRAWYGAIREIIDRPDAYNVVIDVDDPVTHDESDMAAIKIVNRFLSERAQPLLTVANTIFPQAMYRKHGRPAMYAAYMSRYGKLTTKKWGRYFERMICHPSEANPNPLDSLVEKVKTQVGADQTFRSVYELPIYDPGRDANYLRGGQCLSHLSFKVDTERGLMLTAMYRNQVYVARCLGNLIGLGRLQSFIAAESGIKVGPLTCISTHAEVDVSASWNKTDVRQLLDEVGSVLPDEL